MRALAKIMGWTALLGLGLFIGGLIAGALMTWIWGIVLFLGSIIFGPIFQYAADREDGVYDAIYNRYGKTKKEDRMEEQKKDANEGYFSEQEAELIINLMKRQMRLENIKDGEEDPGVDPKITERLLALHKENYMRIQGKGGELRLSEDKKEASDARHLLEMACSSMLYSPSPQRDLRNICSIGTMTLYGAETVIYMLMPTHEGPVDYLAVFLVRTENAIRFFTLERSDIPFLCEFQDDRHVNHDTVKNGVEAADRIEEILKNT